MKKVLEKVKERRMLLIGIIVGIIIFGGGAYAAVIGAGDVSYSNATSGIAANNVQKAVDALYIKAKDAEAKCPTGNTCFFAKIGDYVKLTPTTSSVSNIDTWRVIRLNNDGTMDLVSEYVSTLKAVIGGKEGYKTYIAYLSSLVGSNFVNSKYIKSARPFGLGGKQTTAITSDVVLDYTKPPQQMGYIGDMTEALGLGDTGYETDYNLVKNAVGTLKANEVGTTTAQGYWVASRYYNYSSSNYWSFNGRTIDSNGNLDSLSLYIYTNNIHADRSMFYFIRPIITIKAGLTPTGSGTSSSPYVLS